MMCWTIFAASDGCVVSNKIQRFTEAVVRGLGVGECFDLILGGDSAAEKKPHPALLDLVWSDFKRRRRAR